MTSHMSWVPAPAIGADDRSANLHTSSIASGGIGLLDAPTSTATVPNCCPTVRCTFVEAIDLDSLADRVGEATDRITDEEDHEPADVLVITFSIDVCDRLRHEIGYVCWEDGHERSIICENVHCIEGLEFAHVVIAAASDSMSDTMLQIAIDCATESLTVVGPRSLAERVSSRGPAQR
jgi:hypothetical protein